MGGLFKSLDVLNLFGGKNQQPAPMPIPVPPAAAPTIDEAAKAREAEDVLRRRKGRASTILTGPQGAGAPTTATKTLLGD